MNALFGHVFLIASAVVAVGALGFSILSCKFHSDAFLRLAHWLTIVFAGLTTACCVVLLVALFKNDFTIAYVASYSERSLPDAYKLAASWAGQEGSLLLWAWLLAVMSAIAVVQFRDLDRTQRATIIGTLAVVGGFFAVLMIFVADPFKTMLPAPLDGRGLNPMLQDPAMIIHPPLLFVGYAGFTIPLAIMFGSLVVGEVDSRWASRSRGWLLISWIFLGAGILLGAWWAYIELGWGGYWAWDPVENASLLPWLTATALLHSISVQIQNNKFKLFNALLVAVTFLLCILGTYLTRSGVVQSVHSFGESAISKFFLTFLFFAFAACGWIIYRKRNLLRDTHPISSIFAKDGLFMLANVILVLMALVTLVGTIFPLISGMFTTPVTVKASFYNRAILPLGLLLLAMMAVGPLVSYGSDATKKLKRSLKVPVILAVVALIAAAIAGLRNVWAFACVAITVIAIASIGVDFSRALRARLQNHTEHQFMAVLRMLRTTYRRYGAQTAHLGMIMIMIGVAGSSLFSSTKTFQIKVGQTIDVQDYAITFAGLEEVKYENYTAVEASIVLASPKGELNALNPQRRVYDKSPEQPNSEVAVWSTLLEDVYVTLNGWEAGGNPATLKVVVNPLVAWLWIGSVVLVFGGLICFTPRVVSQLIKYYTLSTHDNIAAVAKANVTKVTGKAKANLANAASKTEVVARRRRQRRKQKFA